MPLSALTSPLLDATPIFDMARLSYGTELLTVAVHEFRLFDRLEHGGLSFDALRQELGLAERPAHVLITALRAMQLLSKDASGQLTLTPLARDHLLSSGAFYMGDYIGLNAGSPGVKAMAERLKSNHHAPARPDEGAAFIFREGLDSAMERESSARNLTLALSGRAKIVAPFLARAVDLSNASMLLDVGGGSGLYAIALLQQFPQLRAFVWDRAEVLKVAAEFGEQYGVADRLICSTGDMLTSAPPTAMDEEDANGPLYSGRVDVWLLSNVLHDWDVPECKQILQRAYRYLPSGGKVLIHDVFLNDDLGGPLNLALYSAALFSLTEGRAYSAREYREWLTEVGFVPGEVIPTHINCGVLSAVKK